MVSSLHKYRVHQQVLEAKFGKRYKEWNDPRPQDDRCIFCNIYEQLWEACETMKAVENTFICCAVNEHLREHEKTLQNISDRFASMGM